nr:heme-binding domain-containing protein [Bryobacter aggregatus]
MRRSIRFVLLTLTVIFFAAQLKQPDLSNPKGHNFKAPRAVEDSLRRACFDCHSHKTVWPWYSQISPVSWFVSKHIVEARKRLNFSRWTNDPEEAANTLGEACDQMRAGQMPPKSYTAMHPEAELSKAEVDAFCKWAINGQ